MWTFIDQNDLRRLQDPQALLNDTCLNSSASVIHLTLLSDHQTRPAASKCTVLSTYVMQCIQTRWTNKEVWRNTKSNLYWQTKVWVVPIHLPGMQHWVVCVIYVKKSRVFFFDSFAEQRTLHCILPVRSLVSLCNCNKCIGPLPSCCHPRH